MDKKVIDYKIVVEGATKSGHPVSQLTFNMSNAAEAMDEMHKLYPHHDVVMYQTVQFEVARFKGDRPTAVCPRGHSGSVDGKPIIVVTHTGARCTTCGWSEGEL